MTPESTFAANLNFAISAKSCGSEENCIFILESVGNFGGSNELFMNKQLMDLNRLLENRAYSFSSK